MTIRNDVRNGAPCWIDLMSSDTARSIEFYGELLGWTAEPPSEEHGGYVNFRLNDERVAGMMAAEPGAPSDVWSVYLKVDDAEATAAAAAEHGGQVHVAAMPVGDLGVMGFLGDAGGAAVGFWQPGEHRGGVVATTGAPCHFELHTREWHRTLDFYRAVFGWDVEVVSDTPDFRYALLAGMPDGEGAGVADSSAWLTDGMAPHWAVYFSVDDVDKALARTEELGGTVVDPAESTPYGRLATATDATGTRFKLRADA
jgi:predicted enzyme related to lactoylglutathione lyase